MVGAIECLTDSGPVANIGCPDLVLADQRPAGRGARPIDWVHRGSHPVAAVTQPGNRMAAVSRGSGNNGTPSVSGGA